MNPPDAKDAPLDWDTVSSPGIAAVSKKEEGRVVFLPLGATEAHGPHLPLATDTIIARELARRSAGRLQEETGTRGILAPAFTTTAATCAAGFPGTVSVPAEVERSALVATLDAYLKAGVRRLCLVNLHFDPDHMGAVHAVLESLDPAAREHVVFPDFTRKENAQAIGGEFATGDCHAGAFETSLMLAAAPGLVQEDHKDLPSRRVGLVKGIREGRRSFRELGMPEAYCGAPADASREEGERLYGVLTDIVVGTCRTHWAL